MKKGEQTGNISKCKSENHQSGIMTQLTAGPDCKP